METVIKQAEESKRNSMESARRLYDDYRPLKHDVDLMRTELLGLDKLPELPNEDKEKMAAIGVMDKPKGFPGGNPMDTWHHAHAAAAAAAAHHHQQQLAAAAAAAAAASGGSSASATPGQTQEEKSFASLIARSQASQGGTLVHTVLPIHDTNVKLELPVNKKAAE